MGSMPNTSKFLKYNIGHVKQWPIQLDAPKLNPPIEFDREWVRVRDGKRLLLDFGELKVPIVFEKRSDEKEARRWLNNLDDRSLYRLENATDSTQDYRSILSFMRTLLPDQLEASPSVVITRELTERLKSSNSKTNVDVSNLGRQAWVQTYNQSSLLFSTHVLSLDSDKRESDVTIYLSNRKKVECKICGEPNKEWLEAISVDSCPPVLLDGRLAKITESPRFVLEQDRVVPINLDLLKPKAHPFLETWIAYENEAIKHANAEYSKRRDSNLEFDSVVKQESNSSFNVRLVNSQIEIEQWTQNTKTFGSKNLTNIRSEVEIFPLNDLNSEQIPAVLQSFNKHEDTGSFTCKLNIQSKYLFPPKGRIVAVHSGGQVRQLERREEALQRLRRGGSACPEMLEIISSPDAIRPAVHAKKYVPRKGSKPLNDRQKEAIRAAFNEPNLYLIQGPPGTGKTSVIVELIRQLRIKYRNRKQADGGALRVLVTSVQNDAVVNAIDKLSSENVEVYSDFGSPSGKQAERNKAYQHSFIQKAERIASELWDAHRGSGEIQAIRRLIQLKEEFNRLNSKIAIEGFNCETAGNFLAVVENQCFQVMPSSLRDDATTFASKLEKAMQASKSHQATTGTTTSTYLPSFGKLVEHSEGYELDAISGLVELVKGSFTDASLKEMPTDELVVAEQWNLLARRLNRCLRKELIDKDCLVAWKEIVDESSTVIASKSGNSDESDVLTRHAPTVHELMERIQANLSILWEQVGNEESAVIVNWIRRLNEEPGCLERIFQNHAPVSTASCQRSSQPRRNSDEDYDIVIVDEAARAGIDILIPMNLGRSVILVGDQNQLSPHVEDSVFAKLEKDVDVDLTCESFFQWMWDRLPIDNKVMLNKQYRMHIEIGEIVSKCFYKGKLTSHWTQENSKRENRSPQFNIARNHPICWINTSDVLQNASEKRDRRLSSECNEFNPFEIQLILKMLSGCNKESLKEWAEKSGNGKAIGILSFYKKQVAEIEKSLHQLPPEVTELVECGTVNSFQGKEFPIVLLSTVRSNNAGKVGFLKIDQMTNVAISRAQLQLVILGDAVTLYRANLEKKRTDEMHPLQLVYHRIVEDYGQKRVIPSLEVLNGK